MHLSKKLNDLLEKKGTKLPHVAEATGIPYPTLVKWFNGITTPSVTKAALIAAYFNVSLDYLVSNEESPTPIAARDLSEAQVAILAAWEASRLSMKEGILRLWSNPAVVASGHMSQEQLRLEQASARAMIEQSKQRSLAQDKKSAR